MTTALQFEKQTKVLIEISFLSDDRKEKYPKLLEERIRRF